MTPRHGDLHIFPQLQQIFKVERTRSYHRACPRIPSGIRRDAQATGLPALDHSMLFFATRAHGSCLLRAVLAGGGLGGENGREPLTAMPDMDGPACFRGIRAVDPDARVVICSGFSRDANIDTLLAAGARGFVTKPYLANDLWRAVELARS